MWQWLDKHGGTPVQRERFKHLVNICTVKPVKVPSTQALQRTSACQGSGSSTTKLSARQQSLATQGSTRFISEASISHKPAALARPATAAAARRRHAVSQRPATATAKSGTLKACNPELTTALSTHTNCLAQQTPLQPLPLLHVQGALKGAGLTSTNIVRLPSNILTRVFFALSRFCEDLKHSAILSAITAVKHAACSLTQSKHEADTAANRSGWNSYGTPTERASCHSSAARAGAHCTSI